MIEIEPGLTNDGIKRQPRAELRRESGIAGLAVVVFIDTVIEGTKIATDQSF